MPYLMGAPFPSSLTALLDVDFSAWDAGFYDSTAFQARSFTAPDKTDMGLTRSYIGYGTEYHTQGETVQTSETTILRSASSTQTDISCIGRHEAARSLGLVVQPTIHNYSPDHSHTPTVNGTRDITSSTGWAAGFQDSVTTGYASSPDQSATGCSRISLSVVMGVGGYSPFGQQSGAGPATFATWQRSKDESLSGDMLQVWTNNAASDYTLTSRAASNVWARVITTVTSAQTVDAVIPVEGRAIFGGPGARDILVDYAHSNRGVYITEAIPTARGQRTADRLRYITGSDLVAQNGQVKFYAKLTPKHASTHTTYANDTGGGGATFYAIGYWTLFRWSSTDYARIRTSDNKLVVKINGGTESVSTNAISFSQYDVVEIEVSVGNSVASVARYKINSGSWVDLVLSTITDVPNPGASAITFFTDVDSDSNLGGAFDGDRKSWTAWVHRLTMSR